jgi:hypothetical protein
MQVQRRFGRLLDVTVKRNGAVNKTIGESPRACKNLVGSDAICLTEDVRKAASVEDALAPLRRAFRRSRVEGSRSGDAPLFHRRWPRRGAAQVA